MDDPAASFLLLQCHERLPPSMHVGELFNSPKEDQHFLSSHQCGPDLKDMQVLVGTMLVGVVVSNSVPLVCWLLHEANFLLLKRIIVVRFSSIFYHSPSLFKNLGK